MVLATTLYYTRRAKVVGASDPGVAAAIATQCKSIESQSKTLATQSKLLQQLCDRLESTDARWKQLESAVVKNTDDVATVASMLDAVDGVLPLANLGCKLWA